MKYLLRIILYSIFNLFVSSVVFAETPTNQAQRWDPSTMMCVTDDANLTLMMARCDTNGYVKTTLGTALSSVDDSIQCLGNVAHSGADSGNPVKVGGIYYAAEGNYPALAEGDRGDLRMTQKGAVHITESIYRNQDYIEAAGDNALETAGNYLYAIIVGTAGVAASVTVYNDASAPCGANKIATLDANSVDKFVFNSKLNNGLCIAVAGTTPPKITVIGDTSD